MTIIKDGRVHMFYEGSIEVIHHLEPGNYEFSMGKVLCLESMGKFGFPGKLYDIEKPFRDQVLKTFRAHPGNTGVLLQGYKGQGKTICAKLLAQESNLPVVLIASRIPIGVDFVSFINSLKTDLVVFVDEFEKLFPPSYSNSSEGYHPQDSFLGFMDGAISSKYKRLFILTTNDSVNDKFMNRPSRIRYFKKYEFMDEKVYDMIIEDKLENKKFEADLRDNVYHTDCTIDLLCSIIDEINIQEMPYSSFKQWFNHKSESMTYDIFEYVAKTKEWKFVESTDSERPIVRGNNNIGGELYKVTHMDADYTYADKQEWRYFDGDEMVDDDDLTEEQIAKFKQKLVPVAYRIREKNRQPKMYQVL